MKKNLTFSFEALDGSPYCFLRELEQRFPRDQLLDLVSIQIDSIGLEKICRLKDARTIQCASESLEKTGIILLTYNVGRDGDRS